MTLVEHLGCTRPLCSAFDRCFLFLARRCEVTAVAPGVLYALGEMQESVLGSRGFLPFTKSSHASSSECQAALPRKLSLHSRHIHDMSCVPCLSVVCGGGSAGCFEIRVKWLPSHAAATDLGLRVLHKTTSPRWDCSPCVSLHSSAALSAHSTHHACLDRAVHLK